MHPTTKIILFAAAIMMSAACNNAAQAQQQAQQQDGTARWITVDSPSGSEINTWIRFTRDIEIGRVPSSVPADICADSKYWLIINGEMAVREGNLKRGPDRKDSYYDTVDLAPWLRRGGNKIEVLVWYFGKSGFSHNDSGRSGLYMEAPAIGLATDSSWVSCIDRRFGTCGAPVPNYRLPESSIHYDAGAATDEPKASVEVSGRNDGPWGTLQPRPIPQWKNFPVRKAGFEVRPYTDEADSVVVRLPYNMQMTPIFTVTSANGGETILIYTDHTFHGAEKNVRAEYVTVPGRQTYENYGWMNGEEIELIVPKSVQVNEVAYRESGYDTEFEGHFTCGNEFYNRFWKKGLRTLYVNMRDTYYDCPDRERAQWWGDETVLTGEAFYTLSTSSHALMRKGMRELVNWRKEDGALFSPIPGSYRAELPGQMLASISGYGFWNYYMNTGDLETIRYVYPAVRDYLALWTVGEDDVTEFRNGGWAWGDWGFDKDMRLIYSGWHIIALRSAIKMAEATGNTGDIAGYEAIIERVTRGYNNCWNGEAYRHPDYKDATDDRVQALAVLAGIAGPEKYPAIFETIRKEEHASPYMEKYVMEALFRMGYGEYAIERNMRRFGPMVNDPERTTLFEGWELNSSAFGGGTSNHAWSGGTLIVIASDICGVRPLTPGWSEFTVAPCSGAAELLGGYEFSIPTVKGTVKTSLKLSRSGKNTLKVTVPKGTTATVVLPWNGESVVKGAGRWTFRQ